MENSNFTYAHDKNHQIKKDNWEFKDQGENGRGGHTGIDDNVEHPKLNKFISGKSTHAMKEELV